MAPFSAGRRVFTGRARVRLVVALLLVAGCLAGPLVGDAQAQAPETPIEHQGQLGPLFFNPGLVFSSGYDTNPWRESGAEAVYDVVETYITPQIAGWMALGHLRVDVFGAIEVVKAGEAVASKNHQFGSNLVWDSPALSPYLTFVSKHTNANPTGFEVGRKSMRNENDLKLGVAVKVGRAHALGYVRQTKTAWDADAMYQSSSLREKLNRNDFGAGGGIELMLTPLTSVRFIAEQDKSEFIYSPLRDGTGRRIGGGISMTGPALISGHFEGGLREFRSASSDVSFSGPFANASLSRTFPTETTIGVRYERDLEFSYDTSLAYFVGQSLVFTAMQPIGDSMATQFTAGRHTLTYDRATPGTVPTDSVGEYGMVLGRRMRKMTWVGVSLELARSQGNQPWAQRRVIGFLTYGSGQFQRLDRPIPFQH
jgi:hypothetical protein